MNQNRKQIILIKLQTEENIVKVMEEILQTKDGYLPLESSFWRFIRKRDQLRSFFA